MIAFTKTETICSYESIQDLFSEVGLTFSLIKPRNKYATLALNVYCQST